MVMKTRVYGDPALRRKTCEVRPGDQATQRLLDNLLDTMRDENGLGLAAPQIGSDCRVCVVMIPPGVDDAGLAASGYPDMPLEMINPLITGRSGEIRTREEGCLSFPGIYAPVSRPECVDVQYLQRDGSKRLLRARGLLSRAIQHEIDHLQGVLFIDHLSAARRIGLSRSLKSLQREARQNLEVCS